MKKRKLHVVSELTSVLRKTLEFVRDHPHCRTADVANFLWPDSLMHRKTSNQGHGATRGKAAWLCGGSITGKLAKRGLLWKTYGPTTCEITSAGRKALEATNEKHELHVNR